MKIFLLIFLGGIMIIGILFLLFMILHTLELLPYIMLRKSCEIFDWHKPNNLLKFDGCSFTSKCKYCHRKILQDGQGNWFSVEEK